MTIDKTTMRELLVRLCVLLTGFGAGLAIDTGEVTETTLIWCCDGTEGGCSPVEFMADCPGGSVLYVCEWGQSSEQSGADGEDGWECLEQ